MTKFEGGPADKVTLMLQRSPLYLRVTKVPQKVAHNFDALDALEDEPRSGEELYAYLRAGEAGRCHVLKRGGKTGFDGSGWCAVATYRFVEQQPSDEIMRDNKKWNEWAESRL